MNPHTIDYLQNNLSKIQDQYYKIIYVNEYLHGNSVSYFAQQEGTPYINLGLSLSEKLLNYSLKQRPFVVQQVFEDLLIEANSKVICLDFIEILFDPSLQIQPLSLLKNLSKNYTLVVAWRGVYQDNTLIYSEVGHPEYYKYALVDEGII